MLRGGTPHKRSLCQFQVSKIGFIICGNTQQSYICNNTIRNTVFFLAILRVLMKEPFKVLR